MYYLKYLALLSVLFLAACSNEAETTDTEVETTEAEEEMVPPYTEYMTCTPGADFSDDNVRAMIDEWNDFDFNDGFFYAAGHVPVESASLGGDNKVYWQLWWESKEDADAGWADWATSRVLYTLLRIFLCSEKSPNLPCYRTSRIHIIESQSGVPPLCFSLSFGNFVIKMFKRLTKDSSKRVIRSCER